MAKIEDLVRKTRPRLVVAYLLLWLAPGIIASLVHLCAAPDYIKFSTRILGAVSNLFGSWATIFAKLGDWPNAGEFFDFFYALVQTAALVVIVMISLITRKKWVQISCVVLFIPLILWWLYIGLVQLGSCAI